MTWENIKRDFNRNWMVYLMALPVIAFYIIFCYFPMWGALISFYDFKPRLGLAGSDFVGLKHFKDFINGIYFFRLVKNTFLLNLWGLVFGFPAPIILALMLNEVKNKYFKKTVQTLTYLPYFISLVVVCGIIIDFCNSDGLINSILALFGMQRKPLLAEPELFRPIYTISGIWQSIGWSSIIYLAALSSINTELYEAAKIDGAGRFKQIWYVTLPGIAPTVIILFILAIGNLMNHGYEKIILLYNPVTYSTSDIISTYVYRRGMQEFDFSFGTAVGLMNSGINFMFLYLANTLSKKYSEVSLW